MSDQIDYELVEQQALKIEPVIRKIYSFMMDFPLRVFSLIFFIFSIYAYFNNTDIGHADLILNLFVSLALFINRLYYQLLKLMVRKGWFLYRYLSANRR